MNNKKQLGVSRVQKGGNNTLPVNSKPKDARPKPELKERNMKKRVYCRKCAYWDRESYDLHTSLGKCRRRAPTPREEWASPLWPETGGGDWCGEGEEK